MPIRRWPTALALALLLLATFLSVGSSVLRGSLDTVPASRALAAAGKGSAKAAPVASLESEDVAPPAAVAADPGSEEYGSEDAAPPPPAPSPLFLPPHPHNTRTTATHKHALTLAEKHSSLLACHRFFSFCYPVYAPVLRASYTVPLLRLRLFLFAKIQ